MKTIHARNFVILSLLAIHLAGCAHTPSLQTSHGTSEAVVQRQLDAYNARDIDAFLDTYSPSIQIYNHPDTIRFSGLDQMRTRYSSLFDNTPNLHCDLVNRIVLGNTVIDQERVTGFDHGRIVRAVAVYEVEKGLIQRVWFIRPEMKSESSQ